MSTDPEVLKTSLVQLRSDIISVLTRLEVEIFSLQYAVLNETGEAITPERLQQLFQAAQTDAAIFRQ